jgi:hypothetical protein
LSVGLVSRRGTVDGGGAQGSGNLDVRGLGIGRSNNGGDEHGSERGCGNDDGLESGSVLESGVGGLACGISDDGVVVNEIDYGRMKMRRSTLTVIDDENEISEELGISVSRRLCLDCW